MSFISASARPSDREPPASTSARASLRRKAGSLAALLGCWWLTCATPAAASGGEIVERLVAIVGVRALTLSDLRAAVDLGLLGEGRILVDERAVALLIDRALMLDEVDRFGLGEPAEGELEERLTRFRQRLGEQAFLRVLARDGLDAHHLRRLAREQIQLERYLGQRFGAMAQPTEDEVTAYYEAHRGEFVKDGVALPSETATEAARTRLTESRRRELVADWVDGLRRRADVRALFPGASPR